MVAINDVVEARRSVARGEFAAGPKDLVAGLVSSLLTVVYGLSFAALIFSGPLSPWIAYGIAASFVASAVTAFVLALRSSLPFVLGGPDGPTAAVTATLVAALAGQLGASGDAERLLAPVLIVMALSAVLTGLLLYLIGMARAGIAIRFIPFPVIGGFLAATGWLMASGAVLVVTGHEPALGTLDALLEPSALAMLAASGLVALAVFLGLYRGGENPWVLPAILLAGLLATYLGLALTGTTLAQAEAAGWMFSPPEAVGLALPWQPAMLRDFPWDAVPPLAGDFLAVMIVTAATMLLNVTGVELATRREANLERELKALGIANLASGALGGYASGVSMNRSLLNYAAGGRSRLCGLIVACVCLAVLLADPHFLSYIPKFLLGGLLLYIGLSLMWQWLIDSAKRLSLLEYASLLSIAVLIVQVGFIAGVAIGVLIGCVTFAVSASRVNAIKFRFDGSEYRSSLDRGPEQLAILAAHGHQTQGMSLQSYLFFGSANRLYEHAKALFADNPDCRFLVIDFGLVTGIDSSAMHSFSKIKQAAEELGARLVLVGLGPELGMAFANRDLLSPDVILAPDLDRALESCEEAIIAANADQGTAGLSLVDWLSHALGSDALAEALAPQCRRIEVEKDEIVALEGTLADCMHFIVEGRIGIMVTMEDGRSIRVRSLGPQTTIGEMGLITSRTRSATIKAEVPSVLYALSAEAYERIKVENPALCQALLDYVVTIMAERLSFASKVIGVLRR